MFRNNMKKIYFKSVIEDLIGVVSIFGILISFLLLPHFL